MRRGYWCSDTDQEDLVSVVGQKRVTEIVIQVHRLEQDIIIWRQEIWSAAARDTLRNIAFIPQYVWSVQWDEMCRAQYRCTLYFALVCSYSTAAATTRCSAVHRVIFTFIRTAHFSTLHCTLDTSKNMPLIGIKYWHFLQAQQSSYFQLTVLICDLQCRCTHRLLI